MATYPMNSIEMPDGNVFEIQVVNITGHADGDIAAPSSPATGAFLVWNGSAWVAQTLSTWQGGNY